MLPDLTGPFRGSAALAAGLVTAKVLRGPRYQRLLPDVYAPADLEPDLGLRSRAAAVLGASCGPKDAPAEVLLLRPRSQGYRCAGLLVRRDRLEPGETCRIGGVRLTTPARTAFDLARWAPSLTERVVAVDALVHGCGLSAADVTAVRHRRLGARGAGGIGEVLQLSRPGAESPMESRVRMALVLGGLPEPVMQHEVVAAGRWFRLDLAYPQAQVAVEYDGLVHRSQRRARRDLLREAALVADGWVVLRFDADVVLNRPGWIAPQVRAALIRRGLAV